MNLLSCPYTMLMAKVYLMGGILNDNLSKARLCLMYGYYSDGTEPWQPSAQINVLHALALKSTAKQEKPLRPKSITLS